MFEKIPTENDNVENAPAEGRETSADINKEQTDIVKIADQLLGQVSNLDSAELPPSKIEEIKNRVKDIVAGHLNGVRAIGYLSSLGAGGFSAIEVATKGVSSAESATLGLLIGAGGVAATEAYRMFFKWIDKLGLERQLLAEEKSKQ